jgi:hypothetical protein
VFSGGRISLLDTPSLVGAAKSGGLLQHRWALPMTEPGGPRASSRALGGWRID